MFRKHLVPDANADNAMKLFAGDSGCCGQAQTVCKYTVAVDPYVTLKSITIKDENDDDLTIAFSGNIAKADLAAEIRIALLANGYLLDDGPGSEPRDVVILTDGTAVTIEIWGDMEVVKLTENDDTARAATALCTSFVSCLYSVSTTVNEATTVAVDGGAPESIGTHATGNAAALKTAIEGSTALGDATEVTVTEDTTDGEYDITLRFEKAELVFADVTQGDVMATRTNCKQDYKA